jgi:hypothetical protein
MRRERRPPALAIAGEAIAQATPDQLDALCTRMLKQVEPAKNQHDASAGVGGDTGRMQSAKDAGLSKRQAKQAIRVANPCRAR